MQRKLYVLLAIIVMLAFTTLLVACGRDNQPAATPTPATPTPAPAPTNGGAEDPDPAEELTSWRIDTSPITFSLLLGDSAVVHLDWGNCEITQFVTEKTGVNIEIMHSTGADMVNALMATNDLPDIVMIGTAPWRDFIEGGLVYQLCELAERYDPTFFDKTLEQVRLWAIGLAQTTAPGYAPEGSLWWYPGHAWDMETAAKWSHTFNSNFSFAVRRDIWEDIGSPDMTTQDSFLQAFRDAHAMFPTINGAPLHSMAIFDFGETGSWSFDELLLNLLAVPHVINGDEWFDRRSDSCFREWHNVLRQMFYEGMFTRTLIIETWDQISERLARGEYFSALVQQAGFASQFGALYAQDPRSTYIPIDGPKNYRGDPHLFGAGGIAGWLRWGVTKNAHDPARAMRFITYMVSEEGRFDMYMGIEDVHWSWNDAGEAIWFPHIQDLVAEGPASTQPIGLALSWSSWIQPALEIGWQEANRAARPPGERGPMDAWRDFFAERGTHQWWWNGGMWPPAGTREADIINSVEFAYGRLMPQWLMAETREEFDRLWAEYDAYVIASGFNEYVIPWRTNILRQNLRNLGLERAPITR